MAWVLEGETTAVVTDVDTDITLPGTPVEGDICLLCGTADLSIAAPNTSGWTELFDSNDNGPAMWVGYKVMGATPDTVVNVDDGGFSDVAYILQTWSGEDTTTPIDVTTTTANGASGDPNAPAITPITDGCLIVAFGGLDDDTEAANVTAPSGYTNLLAEEATGSFSSTTMMASKELASAAEENPAAFGTDGSDEWHACTVALRPASGGPVEIALAGALPTSTGALLTMWLKTLAGSQSASTATLTVQYLAALAGSKPSDSGLLNQIKYLITLTGAQPANAATLAALQTLYRTLTGAQAASTSALAIKYTIPAFTGSKPADNSAISIKYLISLLGSQSPNTATIASLLTIFKTIAGAQPASTAAITFQRLVSLLGNKPADSATIAILHKVAALTGGLDQSGVLDPVSYLISITGDLVQTGEYDGFIRDLQGAGDQTWTAAEIFRGGSTIRSRHVGPRGSRLRERR
jgi:hypothetical protein